MVGTDLRRRAARAGFGVASLGIALALGGCVDNLPAVSVGKGDIRDAIAKGELSSPRAATVALVSLEGAPAAVAAAFRQTLNAEAAHREITLTDPASARYLLRAYLSAYAGDQGVTVSYTYDVYDAAGKTRQQRVADAIVLPQTDDDPWDSLSPSAMTSLAARGADDLALALAGTPEAQAAKGKVAAVDTVPAAAAAEPAVQ